MYDGPHITAEQLITALYENGVLTEEKIISLLGEARHEITLPKLEMALLKDNILSETRLLLLKGMVSGLPTLDDLEPKIRGDLDVSVSKNSGALVLDTAELTVAFIEDLPLNVERVVRALGHTQVDFEIVLMTTTQFADLHKGFYKGEKIDSRPSAPNIFTILDEAVRRRASDIHLKIGRPPALRVDGALADLPYKPVDQMWMDAEMIRLAGTTRFDRAKKEFDADFAYQYGASRFRCNLGSNRHGLTLAARTLPTKVPTPDDIKLPLAVRRFVDLERGLVLVTGPTGSGKSTTLAALLGDIARNQGRHIITLEDPIEFTLPTDGKSIIDQREMGQNFTSFPGGLRQALRQDPDVILVGELRDLETMRTAITAAETGHLVFGTLHTYDASSTIGRLVSSFEAAEQDQIRAQLAYILKGVVSQTLLPHASGRGRVAAYEILTANAAVANNLKKMDGHNQLKQTMEVSKKEGMQTMEMALADLCRRGLVREAEAEFRARDVEDFHRRLSGGDTIE